jgi:hypothetical protein
LRPAGLEVSGVAGPYRPLNLEFAKDAEDVIGVDRSIPRSIGIVNP